MHDCIIICTYITIIIILHIMAIAIGDDPRIQVHGVNNITAHFNGYIYITYQNLSIFQCRKIIIITEERACVCNNSDNTVLTRIILKYC